MISVVIPLYNGERYIERSIRSALAQSFDRFEIIVVNDGSTDRGASLVEAMDDPRIRLVHQENQGVSIARNCGIKKARYDIIALLDADDQWKENHLADIARLIDRFPQCGVFGTSYLFAREGEEPTLPHVPACFTFEGEQGVLDNYYELASGTDFPIQTSSYAFRKSEMIKIGGFPAGILTGEDIVTLALLHTNCDFAYSKNPSSIYYLTSGETKNSRPVLVNNPLDQTFDSLLTLASHRKGVRRFVSSWHKRRMTGAMLSSKYRLAVREFFIAFRLFPFQKKLYTSLLAVLFSKCTGMEFYTLNQKLKGKKNKL